MIGSPNVNRGRRNLMRCNAPFYRNLGICSRSGLENHTANFAHSDGTFHPATVLEVLTLIFETSDNAGHSSSISQLV